MKRRYQKGRRAQPPRAAEHPPCAPLVFVPAGLVVNPIPHVDPGGTTLGREHSGGRHHIHMRSAVGLPFGCVARRILDDIVTRAVQTDWSRPFDPDDEASLHPAEIRLGSSMTDWLRHLGVQHVTGGLHGSYTLHLDQLRRLLATEWTVESRDDDWTENRRFRIATVGAEFAPTPRSEVRLQLTDDFIDFLAHHTVPLHRETRRALGRSPLRHDLYAWLTWRLHGITRRTVVPWRSLMRQFGRAWRSLAAFRRRASDALDAIATRYTAARFEVTARGLVLHPSPPHVDPRPTRGGKVWPYSGHREFPVEDETFDESPIVAVDAADSVGAIATRARTTPTSEDDEALLAEKSRIFDAILTDLTATPA
jgi:hypothetical protein